MMNIICNLVYIFTSLFELSRFFYLILNFVALGKSLMLSKSQFFTMNLEIGPRLLVIDIPGVVVGDGQVGGVVTTQREV